MATKQAESVEAAAAALADVLERRAGELVASAEEYREAAVVLRRLCDAEAVDASALAKNASAAQPARSQRVTAPKKSKSSFDNDVAGRVLAAVEAFDEPCSPEQIRAKLSDISSGKISRTLSRLEKEGLLTRLGKTRGVKYTLTPRASKAATRNAIDRHAPLKLTVEKSFSGAIYRDLSDIMQAVHCEYPGVQAEDVQRVLDELVRAGAVEARTVGFTREYRKRAAA